MAALVRIPDDDWNGGGNLAEGQFCWCLDFDGNIAALAFWVPGQKTPFEAPISPRCNEAGASWTWSGTLDAPTLSPSVHVQGTKTATGERFTIWHGWLRDGEAVSC